MIAGLDRFKEHFAPFSNQFALIGGTACFLAMQEAGLPFRATKDLNIVLHIEVLDAGFISAFWNFIELEGVVTRAS